MIYQINSTLGKIVVRKVEIQNYGGKRCCFGLSFEAHPNRQFEARRGTEEAVPPKPRPVQFISMDDVANVSASKHPSGDSEWLELRRLPTRSGELRPEHTGNITYAE